MSGMDRLIIDASHPALRATLSRKARGDAGTELSVGNPLSHFGRGWPRSGRVRAYTVHCARSAELST
jgi:hypothetical protein